MEPFVAIILFYILTAVIKKGIQRFGMKKQTKPFDRIRRPQQQVGGSQQVSGSGNQAGSSGQQTLDNNTNQQVQSPFKRQMGTPVFRQGQNTESAGAGQRDSRGYLLGKVQQALGKVTVGLPTEKKQQTAAKLQPAISVQHAAASSTRLSEGQRPVLVPDENSSLMQVGRRPPTMEGPTHDETIDHIYKLDDCESPAEDFLLQKKKGELSFAEGMIWAQILGPPRGRQSMLRRTSLQKASGSRATDAAK